MEKREEPLFFLMTWALIFIFCPLQLPFFEWKNSILLPLWNSLFSVFTDRTILIFSDSEGFYLIVTILLILSGVIYSILRKWLRTNSEKTYVFLRQFLMVCLFIIFAKYGLDKIMMLQFPRPEPNLLFSRLGDMDKDILFWTSMGSSRLFNYLTGGLEIFGALLLLFHRTHRLGLMILLLSSLYIVMLNFSFNIGVKLFSLTIFATLLTLNWHTLTFLFKYFLGFGEEKDRPKEKMIFLPILKIVLALSVLLFMSEMNTENRIENSLQGAYEMKSEGKLVHVFVNQQNYWIEEDKFGNKASFEIIAQGKKVILLKDEIGNKKELRFWERAENEFVLANEKGEQQNFKRLDLSKMNLNQDETTWIVR